MRLVSPADRGTHSQQRETEGGSGCSQWETQGRAEDAGECAGGKTRYPGEIRETEGNDEGKRQGTH